MIDRRALLASGAALLAMPAAAQDMPLRGSQDSGALRTLAAAKGFVYGTATASYELKDADFTAALAREAAILAQAPALLVKGGHGEGETIVDRLLAAQGEVARWEDTRIDTTSTHGTGCII